MTQEYFPRRQSPQLDVPLSPRQDRRRLVVAALAAAATWDLIVLVGLVAMWRSLLADLLRNSVLGLALLALAAVVSLALGPALAVFLVARQTMLARMFGPAKLVLSRHPLRPGDRFRAVAGQELRNTPAISKASLRLVGRELAIYASGKHVRVEDHVFHEQEHVEPNPAQDGKLVRVIAELEIPPNAMHSFRGQRSRIEWLLTYEVAVPGRPDVHEEFELTVLPERPPGCPLPTTATMQERVLRPWSGGELAIKLEPGRLDRPCYYVAGEPIAGEVVVDAVEPVQARGLLLELLWYTKGKADPEQQQLWQRRLHEGPIPAGPHRYRFELTLPDGPASYEGQLVSVVWEFRLWIDMALRRDPGIAQPIWLLPATTA